MRSEEVSAVIAALERWLRQEVAPVLAAGASCKAIINCSATGDVRTVIEKHVAVDVRSREDNALG